MDRVLDIGCGVGRLALPLTQFLDTGSYDGVDPVVAGIDWCTSVISPLYPNVRFQHLDLRHPLYNPGGALETAKTRLPFADGSFDLICMISVLTHLEQPEALHYAAEVARLLAPGGRCFATAFLMNPPARAALQEGDRTLKFDPASGGPLYFAIPDAPLAARSPTTRTSCSSCSSATAFAVAVPPVTDGGAAVPAGAFKTSASSKRRRTDARHVPPPCAPRPAGRRHRDLCPRPIPDPAPIVASPAFLHPAGTAAHQRPANPGTPFQAIGNAADEILVWTGGFDPFFLSQIDLHGLSQPLSQLLREQRHRRPVVHIHHVMTLGVEIVGLIRRCLPNTRIVMTLHDYYPLCANDGQMVTRAGALCPRRPARCLPLLLSRARPDRLQAAGTAYR